MATTTKISTKIILLILSLVTLTVVLESAVSYYENRELIKEGVIKKFQIINEDNNEKIEEHIEGLRINLKSFVDAPVLNEPLQDLLNPNKTQRQIDSIGVFLREKVLTGLKENLQLENIFILSSNNKTLFNFNNNGEFRTIDNQYVNIKNRKFEVSPATLEPLEPKKFYNYISLPIETSDGFAHLICKINSSQILASTIFKDPVYEKGTERIVYKKDINDFFILDTFAFKNKQNYVKKTFTSNQQNKIGHFNDVYTSGDGEYYDKKEVKYIASWQKIEAIGLGILTRQPEHLAFMTQDTFSYYTMIFGIIIIIVALIFSFLFSRVLTYPLQRLKKVLELVAEGSLPAEFSSPLKDEIGQMIRILNRIISSMRKTADFARNIGQGNFESDFKPISNKDTLGLSLIQMRESLLNANRNDDLRNWIISGVAEIGDLLRSNDSLEDLGDDILKYTCSKLEAAQGTFYIVQENRNKTTINISSTYAYNRKKFLKKSFEIGDGLVGQAVLEKDMIYRTEIPEDYINISSGILGDQKPNALLIIPLIAHEKVYGVLEFCSIANFTSNQLKFIQEVSEIIARTIHNLNNSARTKKLLSESQRLGSELQLQQTELQSNAEKMEATQRQLEESNKQLEEQITEVNNAQNRTQSLLENASEVITIYDRNGIIKYISPSVEHILGYKQDDLIGFSDLKFIDEPSQVIFKKLFEDIKNNKDEGKPIKINYFKKTGDKIWLEATAKNLLHSPAIEGIVLNSTDITERIRAEQEERKRGQMQSLSENSLDLILRLDKEGFIFYCNPMIKQLTGIDCGEFMNKHLETTNLNHKTSSLLVGISERVFEKKLKHSTEIKFIGHEAEFIMQVNAIPEFNEQEQIESVLLVAHDVTERKKQEIDLQNTNTKINDSINYAEEIQKSIIPDTTVVNQYFTEGFVMFKPKDVVSGDFPWLKQKGDDFYIAVVDCTGHGVPGAMISFVGFFLLNNIIDSHPNLNAGEVLDLLDTAVIDTLKQNNEHSKLKDGMDISICKINKASGLLDYAGAHRPLYLMRESGDFEEIKGNKFPIGGGNAYTNKTSFTNHQIDLKSGDSLYMFSDGLPDQFNPNNEKFTARKIRRIIQENKTEAIEKTQMQLESEFIAWKKSTKQTDDILLIGLKF